MASTRQIAANGRNALKSTGPRSKDGKKRAARNSFRHGLSVATLVLPDDEEVERLARRICGDVSLDSALQYARAAARAQLQLAHIRKLKAEIINRTFLFGALELRPRWRSTAAEIRYIKMQPFDKPMNLPPRIDLLGPMPPDDADRMNEALRRSLPELRKLDRYERRAIARRERAMNQIFDLAGRGTGL